jgi:hypothetical protein
MYKVTLNGSGYNRLTFQFKNATEMMLFVDNAMEHAGEELEVSISKEKGEDE